MGNDCPTYGLCPRRNGSKVVEVLEAAAKGLAQSPVVVLDHPDPLT